MVVWANARILVLVLDWLTVGPGNTHYTEACGQYGQHNDSQAKDGRYDNG
jgi:hypothetical protein